MAGGAPAPILYGMPQYLLHHRHDARECLIAFAAWKGHESPLRHRLTLASRARAVMRSVDRRGRERGGGLGLLPIYLANRTEAAVGLCRSCDIQHQVPLGHSRSATDRCPRPSKPSNQEQRSSQCPSPSPSAVPSYLLVLAVALLAALVPSMANAATPRRLLLQVQGLWLPSGRMKYGSFNGTVRKFLKVGATTQLTCPSGEVKEDYFSVYIIMGGKIDRYGRFKYSYKGFNFRAASRAGRAPRARLRTVGDCTSQDVTWTAKKSSGGIPLPTS